MFSVAICAIIILPSDLPSLRRTVGLVQLVISAIHHSTLTLIKKRMSLIICLILTDGNHNNWPMTPMLQLFRVCLYAETELCCRTFCFQNVHIKQEDYSLTLERRVRIWSYDGGISAEFTSPKKRILYKSRTSLLFICSMLKQTHWKYTWSQNLGIQKVIFSAKNNSFQSENREINKVSSFLHGLAECIWRMK